MLRNASTSAGVWVTVISVLMQIPLWFLATSASDFHDLVWGFPELFEPPYSPYIKPSSALAYGLSVVAIVWTIVSAFCGCAGPNINGRYYLFSGLLYAGLVSACFTAAYLQSTFLPKPLGKCWNADIWPYNQTYNTSAPTLFEVLGGNATAAGDRCSDLTFVWELEITMGILLTVNCLITWILAVKVFLSVTRNRPYEPSGSLAGDIWWFLKYFMLTPLLCPFKLLWWPVEPLVVKVFSGLRYWFRYREKKLQYLEVTEEIAMGSYPKQTTDLESQNESPLLTMVELYKKNQIVYDRRRSTMEVVLSCYNPVLDSILTGLHYVDIVNLGLVSETIRNALDTKSDEALKRAACVDGTESACWNCRKQICRDCKVSQALKCPVTTNHLGGCKLICSKCFYKSCCNSRFTKGGLKPRPTACSGHDSNSTTIRELCQNCFLLNPDGILAIQRKREEIELVQVSEASKNCVKCTKLVDTKGPRWWICMFCQKECTESYHSAWSLSKDT